MSLQNYKKNSMMNPSLKKLTQLRSRLESNFIIFLLEEIQSNTFATMNQRTRLVLKFHNKSLLNQKSFIQKAMLSSNTRRRVYPFYAKWFLFSLYHKFTTGSLKEWRWVSCCVAKETVTNEAILSTDTNKRVTGCLQQAFGRKSTGISVVVFGVFGSQTDLRLSSRNQWNRSYGFRTE